MNCCYYIDKTKPGNSSISGEPLKQEHDILYQWRLRRKLEQQKNAQIYQIPDLTTPTNIAELSKPIPQIIMPAQTVSTTNKLEVVDITNKISSQTQTSTTSDLCVQTSIDIDQIPTLDRNSRSKIDSSNNKNEARKNYSKSTNSSSSNKMSEAFSLPQQQHKFSSKQHPKLLKNSAFVVQNKRKQVKVNGNSLATTTTTLTTTSIDTMTTASSSVCSTITNITARTNSPPSPPTAPPVRVTRVEKNSIPIQHEIKPSIYQSNNPLSKSPIEITKEMDKTITISNKNNDNYNERNKSSSSNHQNCISNNNSLGFEELSYDVDDKDLFESDEILQILFRKTYYYQKKIRFV